MNFIACGGNFFTLEGFIKSPNFPDDYPRLKECTWIINVPVTNQIELNISQFLIEESNDCRFDFLEIRLAQIIYKYIIDVCIIYRSLYFLEMEAMQHLH